MFRVIAVGDDFHHFAAGIEEYKKRLPTLSLKLIKSEKSTEIPRIIARETDRIIEYLEKEKLSIIYLDISGKTFSTEAFARYVEKVQIQKPKFAFLIGGAYGVDLDRLRPYCIDTFSLSPMTFPHGLALLVLLEQIYRVEMIKK